VPEPIDEYLADLELRLQGDRAQSGRERRRLVEELAAHLDDVLAAGLAVGLSREEASRAAVDRTGDLSPIVDAAHDRALSRRVGDRRRVAFVTAAAAAATVLGVVQHANGQRPRPVQQHCVAVHPCVRHR
jgi:hypothetical protein